MESWFYCINGRQEGPVSFQGLRDMVVRGDLGEATPIWEKSMPRWVQVRRYPDLANLLPRVPAARMISTRRARPKSSFLGGLLDSLLALAQGRRK